MYLLFENSLREALRTYLQQAYNVQPANLMVEQPPRSSLGDFAMPVCFELARTLRQAPRKIAEEIAAKLPLPPGFQRVEPAGGGYLNFFLDRAALWTAGAAAPRDPGLHPRLAGKVVVEHTNINPNKAAHVGHLRNAVLGDTFVRLLRRRGELVEVQNYIDNTGVQVADVVAAFEHLLKQETAEVAATIQQQQALREAQQKQGLLSPQPHALALSPLAAARQDYSFDYVCWDLYAQVSRHYEEQPDSQPWRASTLHAIEAQRQPTAGLAEAVASAIVHAHLTTMQRINVSYDVLPRESEILHLRFWHKAFALLQQSGAIRLEAEGKNAGCWVMDRALDAAGNAESEGESETKVIVRSNGTVTYVGKDIAYQLWKFGLLGQTFPWRPFFTYPGGQTVWESSLQGEANAPAFGAAQWVFNVIDVRQSYLQEIVIAGLRALGFEEAAQHSTHFSYEMVALTPRCASELGYQLSTEEQQRSHIEVSGRKGFGIKADDLLDRLIQHAWEEVKARHPENTAPEQLALAIPIAVGALRYFLLKFTKTSVIAFDFQEALSFEGETGPYVQYAAVRAANILRKAGPAASGAPAPEISPTQAAAILTDDELWELTRLALRLDAVVDQCLATLEPAYMAKYAFQLAQSFNNFYHRHPVIAESDPARRTFFLNLVALVRKQLTTALETLGIEVPEAM